MLENNILTKAKNVVIAGSNIQTNAFNYQVPETHTPARGLGLLFERSALSALVDSNARYDAPKCDEGTREAIVQKIMDWIESDEDRASALWLHGSAGSGKSALARTIAELCAARKSLVATFFFSRTRTDRITDGNLLIPTLAYQLAEKMFLPQRYIKKCLLQDPGIFFKTREVQMRELIINPLGTYFSRLEYHYKRLLQKAPLRLIVIDGLDECSDKDVQRDLLRVLAQAVDKLRLPVRFLIASRPETQIRDFINDDGVLKTDCLSTLNLSDDLNTAGDIKMYLEVKFTRIRNMHKIRSQIPPSWPSAEDITTLVERASGQFIYVSTIVGYVGDPGHNPVTRLTIIIERLQPPPADAPYGQLDLLYQFIFSSAEELGKDIDKVLQILGILIVVRPEGALDHLYSTYLEIGNALNISPGDVVLLLDEFVSLIELPPLESDRPIRVLHASMADFLLDSQRSDRFCVDMRRIHEVLASYYSRYIPTRISEMTTSTHCDDLKHHFLPFITHWKHANIPADDAQLCNTMLLVSEAMIFLCQCLEPCEDILWTAYHELLAGDLLPTSALVSEWNKHVSKQRPVIIAMSPVTPPKRHPIWNSLDSRPFSLLERIRHIGRDGPEGSLVQAVKFGDNLNAFGKGEVIVIDIPLVSHDQSEAVLKWLKRLEIRRINFSGVLFYQDINSDMDCVQPGGVHREIFNHCWTLCPIALVLIGIRRSWNDECSGEGWDPQWRNINSRLMTWQQTAPVGRTFLWSNYQNTEQSAYHTLWDLLSETKTWKQQQKDRHKHPSSVLKEIGVDKCSISEEAWERALQIPG